MLVSVLSSYKRRRSHFWMRVSLLLLVPAVLPALFALSASVGLVREGALHTTGLRVAVMCPLSLILAPAFLYRGSSAPPGDSRGDSRGGSDPWPEPPPDPPEPSGEGIPLPDADQSPKRVRDHNETPRPRGPRRSTREPQRTPA